MKRLFGGLIIGISILLTIVLTGCSPLTEEQKAVIRQHQVDAVKYVQEKYPDETFQYSTGGYLTDYSYIFPSRDLSTLVYKFQVDGEVYEVQLNIESGVMSDNFQIKDIRYAYEKYIQSNFRDLVTFDVNLPSHITPNFDGDVQSFSQYHLVNVVTYSMASDSFEEMIDTSKYIHQSLSDVGCYAVYTYFEDSSDSVLFYASYSDSRETTYDVGYILNANCNEYDIELYVKGNDITSLAALEGLSPYVDISTTAIPISEEEFCEYQIDVATDNLVEELLADKSYNQVYVDTGAFIMPYVYYLDWGAIRELPGLDDQPLYFLASDYGITPLGLADWSAANPSSTSYDVTSLSALWGSTWGICLMEDVQSIRISVSDMEAALGSESPSRSEIREYVEGRVYGTEDFPVSWDASIPAQSSEYEDNYVSSMYESDSYIY